MKELFTTAKEFFTTAKLRVVHHGEDVRHYEGVLRHGEAQVKNDSSLEFATTKRFAKTKVKAYLGKEKNYGKATLEFTKAKTLSLL